MRKLAIEESDRAIENARGDEHLGDVGWGRADPLFWPSQSDSWPRRRWAGPQTANSRAPVGADALQAAATSAARQAASRVQPSIRDISSNAGSSSSNSVKDASERTPRARQRRRPTSMMSPAYDAYLLSFAPHPVAAAAKACSKVARAWSSSPLRASASLAWTAPRRCRCCRC